MRQLVACLVVAVVSCLPASIQAQAVRKLPPEIKKIHVGFQAFDDRDPSAYKVGLWTPVHIELDGGTDGIQPKQNRTPYIEIATTDSDDVGTTIRVPVVVDPFQTRTFTGYVKTGHQGHGSGEIRVTLHANGRTYEPTAGSFDQYRSLNIDAHLYLALGSRMSDLHRAVRKIGKAGDEKEQMDSIFQPGFRQVAYEDNVELLPEHWFGYNCVDLIVLSTEKRSFLTALGNETDRLKALAQWVRRGGRLVVPISWQSQDAVVALLKAERAWDPPIPVVPPRAPGNAKEMGLKRLNQVEDWAGVRGEPFARSDPKNPQLYLPISVAQLDDGKVHPGDWEIWAASADGRPLIARVRYGLGQIIYFAFSLEDSAFFGWNGKEQFLKHMVQHIASRGPHQAQNQPFNQGFRPVDYNDLSSELLRMLDDFDVTVIPFGYVALFIVLYILVVGPLDFILLKYVFKRMEWTWITFPAVVLAVSVVAYFAAYALKGRDLKINKIDIVDFDLRTDLDAQRQPRSVHAYGQSFFTILSPRIQNYTIGLEPNAPFWGGNADKLLSVDLMSWMGRPSGGPHEMGRSGSAGFFRNAYTYREDATGLEGVPIPVWTTKAFAASWEQTLAKAPLTVNLTYHQKEVRGKDLKVTGTLENHLGVDLVDAWLIYADKCYPIPNGLQRAKQGGDRTEISLPANSARDVNDWVNQGAAQAGPGGTRVWTSEPTPVVKKLLFHQRSEHANTFNNHLLRTLDLSWRLDKGEAQRDRRTREAILFARAASVSGDAEIVTQNHPLPTKLWLGEIPDGSKSIEERPALNGQMNQETYVRVILPVRPAQE